MAMFYNVPEANEALIISGGFRRQRKPEESIRVVVGSGVFTLPVIHKVRRFPIGARNVNFPVIAQTRSNIEIKVEASVAFKVDSSPEMIARSAVRFLGEPEQVIVDLAKDVFSGATRALIGSMDVEEIISDRLSLAEKVLDTVESRMLSYGWQVMGFQINSISDDNGHIDNLSKPELDRVRRDAETAVARNNAEIVKVQSVATQDESESRKQMDLKTSQNEIETAQKRAEAELAFELARAQESKRLVAEQTELEKTKEANVRQQVRNRDLVTAEVEAEKMKLLAKAEADAEAERVAVLAKADADAVRVRAQADAEATRMRAEAFAENVDAATLERLFDVLPQVVASVAEGQRDANLTVIGDQSTVSGSALGVVGTAFGVWDSLRSSIDGLVDNGASNDVSVIDEEQ